MTIKNIEKELNGCVFVNDYDVEINHTGSFYIVDINFINPQDSSDMVILLNLKKKIRSVVHRSYNIKFSINFIS